MRTNQDVIIAGADEVGVAPLAGPVVAAAVILDPANPIEGLKDSKLLSPKKRQTLSEIIKSQAVAWAIGEASVEEIDTINILQASLLAMQRAVAALGVAPTQVLVDGRNTPQVNCAVQAIIGGDKTIPAISAASIVAKVTRDQQMCALGARHPEYGFEKHKGYPTKQHMQALREHGVLPEHRRSFKPVRLALAAQTDTEMV